ncbi:MAG: hypothetical protein ACK5WR_22850 [Planctomycetaceae bacterium]
MPRRITEFRLLAESLRAWLSEVDAEGDDRWPKYKQLFRHLRESLDWSGSEREYKTLRQLGYGPARLVEGVLGYLCLNARRHVVQFLGSQGRTDGETISAGELVEQYSANCDESQIQTDWRGEGWRRLTGMFSAALLGVDERSLCRSEQEVRELVRWTVIDVGRGLAGDPQGLQPRDPAEFLARGEAHMGRSVAMFQDQVLAWWEQSPWSVLKAVCGEEQVGGSVMLPLRREAYHDLRDGRLSDLELSPDLIQVPSRYFLGEALASSLPKSVRTRVGWASARQMTTIIYQVARQSFTTNPAEGAGEPIHILCVGGTPEMEQRLQRHGYTPVAPLKGFDVRLYELVMPSPETQGWFPTSAGKAYAAVISACHAQMRQVIGNQVNS